LPIWLSWGRARKWQIIDHSGIPAWCGAKKHLKQTSFLLQRTVTEWLFPACNVLRPVVLPDGSKVANLVKGGQVGKLANLATWPRERD
jgi:hypothetical protein